MIQEENTFALQVPYKSIPQRQNIQERKTSLLVTNVSLHLLN